MDLLTVQVAWMNHLCFVEMVCYYVHSYLCVVFIVHLFALENTLLPYGTEVGDLSFSVSSVRSFGSFDSFDVPIIFYRQDITEVFVSAKNTCSL